MKQRMNCSRKKKKTTEIERNKKRGISKPLVDALKKPDVRTNNIGAIKAGKGLRSNNTPTLHKRIKDPVISRRAQEVAITGIDKGNIIETLAIINPHKRLESPSIFSPGLKTSCPVFARLAEYLKVIQASSTNVILECRTAIRTPRTIRRMQTALMTKCFILV
jgi:hypothetical protein